MRKKTLKERQEQLKNDLQISDIESDILEYFLRRQRVTEERPTTYYKIKTFCDYHAFDFTMLNNVYLKWLNHKAKQLNKIVLHGLLIRPNETNGKLYINQIDFIDNLQAYYHVLKCERIDIQERKINGRIYDFIIDDEYLLKEPKESQISAIELTQNEILFNRFIILGKANKEGQETSLTDEDIQSILKSLAYINIGTKEEPKNKIILIYNF